MKFKIFIATTTALVSINLAAQTSRRALGIVRPWFTCGTKLQFRAFYTDPTEQARLAALQRKIATQQALYAVMARQYRWLSNNAADQLTTITQNCPEEERYNVRYRCLFFVQEFEVYAEGTIPKSEILVGTAIFLEACRTQDKRSPKQVFALLKELAELLSEKGNLILFEVIKEHIKQQICYPQLLGARWYKELAKLLNVEPPPPSVNQLTLEAGTPL